MTVWREDLVLLRLPLLRLRFPRREWDAIRRIRVGVGTCSVIIDVAVVEEATVRGGRRHWLRCTCGRHTSVMALSSMTGQVGCRSCLGWRSRSSSVMSPLAVLAGSAMSTSVEVGM
jgi:hypothetical protein